MTGPALPTSRDERIALAARLITSCLGPDDQMDDGFERDLEDSALVVWKVSVPRFQRSLVLGDAVVKALEDAGFEHPRIGSSRRTGEWTCWIRVKVGAP